MSFCMNASSSISAPNKLVQGISYFEEVLQLVPNDRSALEFLAVAYEQAGDGARRSHTIARLTDVLIAEKDFDCLKGLVPTLREINTPETLNALAKIQALLAPREQTPSAPAVQPTGADLLPDVKAELELLQFLEGRGVLSSETAKIAESSLYDTLSEPGAILISALNFIKNENPAACEKALACLADAFQTPPVPLTAARAAHPNVPTLPAKLARRGACPFAVVGDTYLVAILNPADKILRKAIVDALDGPCRFFLVDPSEMEDACR